MVKVVAPYTVGEFRSATLKDAISHLNSKNIIAVDSETTGLDPFTDSMVMLQVGDEDTQFVIDLRHVDITPLKGILEDPGVVKVLVNAKFDYRFLAVHYGIRMENMVDCMLAERLILGGRPGSASLEALSKKYTTFSYTKQLNLFEESLSKDIRTEFVTLGDQPFSPSQVLYGAYDVILPLQIHHRQQEVIDEQEMQVGVDIENEFAAVLGDIETNGFYLDIPQWGKIGEQVEVQVAEKLKELETWLSKNGYGNYLGINWNSSKQVAELFNEIGIPIQVVDKKHTVDPDDPVYKDSVQKTVISKFEGEYDVVRLYLEYKVLAKSLNTYGDKFLKNIHPVTGRIHSNYNQILNTGRMSSTSPNLQNIKRDSDYRQCFVPQDERYVLVVTDYSQQELRVMGDAARESNMIDFYVNKKGDLHSYTAEQMFKVQVTQDINPHLRFRAKTLNFGIPYGVSAHKIANEFKIPLKEAEIVINKWYATYPGLRSHFKKMQQFAKENGYIVIDPITNRRYYPDVYDSYKKFDELITYYKARNYEIPRFFWSKFYSALGAIDRKAQNYPIQGTSASMTKLAANLIRRHIRDNNLWDQVKIVNIVHDEIVVECLRSLSSEVSLVVKKAMEDAGAFFCKHIPMEATPVITEHWKH